MITFKTFIVEDAEYDRIQALGDKLESEHPFTKKNEDAVREYTAQSTPINNHLWMKHGSPNKRMNPETNSEEDYKNKISALDEVTKHKTKEPLTLYSKSIHDPREKAKDGIMHHPAYMSTSIKRSVASGLKWNEQRDSNGITHHHVYKIEAPAGTQGGYLGTRSSAPTQREFLLHRGTNLKYIETKTQEDKNNHYHTHHMEVVP